ncbi:unnamed protein product [Rhizopus stolonifer]
MFRHLSSSGSVIIDVLRAIVSRPSTNHTFSTRCISHEMLTANRYETIGKLYATLANSFHEEYLDTKKDTDSKGKSRAKRWFSPTKRKTEDGRELL